MWAEIKAGWAASQAVIRLLVALGLLGFFLLQHLAIKDRDLEISRLSEEIAISQRDSARRVIAAQEKVRQAEHKLAENTAKSREEIRKYEKAISDQRAGLLTRLRAAEERARRAGMSKASTASGNGEVVSGDVGAEFPGTIGPEHVEEAYRADLIRKHLIECYVQYDAARVIYNE